MKLISDYLTKQIVSNDVKHSSRISCKRNNINIIFPSLALVACFCACSLYVRYIFDPNMKASCITANTYHSEECDTKVNP